MIKIFTKFWRISDGRGFGLIEFLTTVFVFSLVGLLVTGIFAKSLEMERRSFNAQIIQENILAVLELMAKEIRVGTIEDQDNDCTNTTLTLDTYEGGGNPVLINVVYSLSQGSVLRQTGGNTYVLSTNEVRFNRLIFCVTGSDQPSDRESTRVTILASVSNLNGKIMTVDLQTTITARDMTLELQNPL